MKTKSFINKKGHYTKIGHVLSNKLHKQFKTLFKKYKKLGYSAAEIQYMIIAQVTYSEIVQRLDELD